MFDVAPVDVTLDQRSKAKMVSYGLAYGMEAYGLGQRLNIPTEEAAKILDAYFEAFPNVKAYMDATVVEARKRGYTETLFGRRRPIPELLNGNWRIRQAGERQAMNAGIQGLAADIFKVALVRIDAGAGASAGSTAGSCCRCTTRCSSRCPTTSARSSARSSSTSCAAPPTSTSRSRSTSPGAPPGPNEPMSPPEDRRPLRPRRSELGVRSTLGVTGMSLQRRPSDESRATSIHWFEPIAEHLGAAYLRYSFTKGTVQEVDHLVGALGLEPGTRVLDVGCGPGRHAHELARRGSSSTASTSPSGSSTSPARTRRRAPRSSASTPGRCRSTPSSTPWSACARAPSG